MSVFITGIANIVIIFTKKMFQDLPEEKKPTKLLICKLKKKDINSKSRRIQTCSSTNPLICVLKLKHNNGEKTTLKYSQNCESKLLQATGVQITNEIILKGCD